MPNVDPTKVSASPRGRLAPPRPEVDPRGMVPAVMVEMSLRRDAEAEATQSA